MADGRLWRDAGDAVDRLAGRTAKRQIPQSGLDRVQLRALGVLSRSERPRHGQSTDQHPNPALLPSGFSIPDGSIGTNPAAVVDGVDYSGGPIRRGPRNGPVVGR